MLIDAQDAFKIWLTAVLKPLCEADPAALAKYVIALIKKDKTEEELRKTMKEQLLVFLQDETTGFVDQVFHMLESKEYLTNPVIPSTNPPNPTSVKSPKEGVKEIKNGVSPGDSPVNDALNKDIDTKKEVEVKKDFDLKKDREFKKSDTEKEEKPRRRSRHRSLSRNRTRSRSRSWDRARRSRSREKSRDRDQQHRIEREKRERTRQWRNKSPPRRFERRRSRTPSPNRLRSRSRSPRHPHRGRYRNRTPPRSASTSRSRSPPEKRERKDSGKDKDPKEMHSRPGTPTQDSNHGDLDLRLTNSTQSIQRAVTLQSKKRCRDFDERGYCMRGDLCLFDHGVDPVVLEDTTLTSVLAYNPNGTQEVPPVIPPVVAPGHAMMGPRMVPPEYNPQAPQMWNRAGGYRGPRPVGLQRLPQMTPFQQQTNMQRELIPVPVLDNKKPEPYGNQLNNQPHQNFLHNMDGLGFKKKNFDYTRLGPRTKNLVNCSLELKKVPPGMNTILHLHEHFSKFGTIVNIQVNYEGDSEAALVTFSSHAEANAAYRSTEAVLNNRFIKVFWHNNGDVQPRADNAPAEMEGMNNTTNGAAEKAAAAAKSAAIREEVKAQETAAIKKNQDFLAAKQRLETMKKNQVDTKLDTMQILRNRYEDMKQRLLVELKELIEKTETMPHGPQREEMKASIKKLQLRIDELKSSIEKMNARLAALVPTIKRKKTKEEAQKEVLDMELDLMTKQQEGIDTTELQRQLLLLKAKNKTFSSATTTFRGRGRGRKYTPVSRHLLTKNNLIDGGAKSGSLKLVNHPSTSAAASQKHAVDHRPSTLLVSGYETEEQEAVMTFFKQFGEIVDHHIDNTLPSVILNYKTRKEAETALVKGKHFQDRTLSVTWCNGMPAVKNTLTRSSSRTLLMSESEEEHMIDDSLLGGDDELVGDISEEVLLHDDEEEEEENEDRSWRR